MSPLLLMLACSGSPTDSQPDDPAPDPVALRVATFNVSMFRPTAGQLAADLATGADPQAIAAATVLQEVRPDVLLLNEFDHDADGAALDAFVDNYLAVSQDGRAPLDFPHRLAPPSNTGLSSGFDLNNDGAVVTEPGSREYGEDCWGFGEFPGQYALAVLSRHPISAVRTFQTFRWAEMDDPQLPDGWYGEAEAEMRLSSKTHADLLLDVGGHPLHVLVSHPTPPGFDGPENRNGLRNAAEIRFWTDYLAGDPGSYHVDDAGQRGGIGAGPFVLLGDLNTDPEDGDELGAMSALLAHPRVNDVVPTSAGAAEAAERQGGVNEDHGGDPAADTADFSEAELGNLRVDYVLPSTELTASDAGVFWPAQGDPLFDLVARAPFALSDHRLVWVDLTLGG